MKKLKFHKDFRNPIIDKVKVSTSRLSDKKLREGDEFEFLFVPDDDMKTLRGVIARFEIVNFRDLNNFHASNEGYNHVDLLKT